MPRRGVGLVYTTKQSSERKGFFTRKAAKLVQAPHTHHSSQLNKRTQEMLAALA